MEEKNITIDKEKCKKDGLCSRVCGVRIFSHEKKEYPSVQNTEYCVLCGECIAICPSGSISHSMLDRSRFRKIKNLAPVDVDVVESLFHKRRSVLVYKKELLGFPSNYEVYSAATLGYRGIELLSIPHRETKVSFIGGNP